MKSGRVTASIPGCLRVCAFMRNLCVILLLPGLENTLHRFVFVLLFFSICFQCSVSRFRCRPLHRKHLACDAGFIVGTIINSITDEPNARLRDERKKTQKKKEGGGVKKKKKRDSGVKSHSLMTFGKNQHHRGPRRSSRI